MRQLVVLIIFWTPVFLAFIDPFYGVLGYKLSNIIRPEQLMWGDASAAGRIFLAMQGACFVSWVLNKDNLTPNDTPVPFQVPLMAIVAVEMTIVTFGFALDQAWSWRWTFGFWKVTIFCFIMVKSINTAKKLELYYALSLVWSTLLAIWGIQQKFGGNANMEGLGGVLIPERNGMASLYVMYLPMAYYTIFSRNKRIKFFIGIPSFIIFFVFILFTNSRQGFLGIIACMGWIFLRTKGTQKFKMILISIVLGTVLGFILVNFSPEGFLDEYTARLTTIMGKEDENTGEVELEASASGRTAMWKGALHIYRTHSEYWLFGVGMHCYSRIYYRYHIHELADVLDDEELSHVLYGGSGGKDMHNSYLNVLLGGGAVTFVTWLFLIVYVWFQAASIPRKYPRIVDGVDIHNYARAIETGILGWCLTMVFGTREFIDFFYLYTTMSGIIVNLGKAKLKREALGEEEDDEEELQLPASGHPSYAPR